MRVASYYGFRRSEVDKEENGEYESLDDEIEELERLLKEKRKLKKKQEAEM